MLKKQKMVMGKFQKCSPGLGNINLEMGSKGFFRKKNTNFGYIWSLKVVLFFSLALIVLGSSLSADEQSPTFFVHFYVTFHFRIFRRKNLHVMGNS